MFSRGRIFAPLVREPTGDGTCFRLPPQRSSWEFSWFLFTLWVVGSYVIYLFIYGTLRYPEDERAYDLMALGVGFTLFLVISFTVRSRVCWQYELLLSTEEVRVYYVASRIRYLTARIDLRSIQRFILVRHEDSASLHAEVSDDGRRLLLREGAAEVLQQLAQMLVKECQTMVPQRPLLTLVSEPEARAVAPESGDSAHGQQVRSGLDSNR